MIMNKNVNDLSCLYASPGERRCVQEPKNKQTNKQKQEKFINLENYIGVITPTVKKKGEEKKGRRGAEGSR